MAGTVRALLLKPTESGDAEVLPAVPLAAAVGLALVPLTAEIVGDVMGITDDGVGVAGFYDLTSGIAQWARRRSRHGVIAYVHIEFFGGDGFHAAVAWRHQTIA
jgi:hypothetical protein